jgi:hypothetical protein
MAGVREALVALQSLSTIKKGTSLDSFRSPLKVKQIVEIPTTRGNTSLNVILTNMHNFYSPPSALPPSGGTYHLSILLFPSSNFKHSFSITYGTYCTLQNSGLLSFGMWLNTEDWCDIYSLKILMRKWLRSIVS